MSNYGIYEHESRERAAGITPSPFYKTIPGAISRVQMKSLDASVGKEPQDVHVLELTVDLHYTAGPTLSTGSTRSVKLKTPEAIAGLMRDLKASLLTDLLGKQVMTHYDASQTPAYVAISHPDLVRNAADF